MKKPHWILSLMVGNQTFCPFYYQSIDEVLNIIADVTIGIEKWIQVDDTTWFKNSEIQHIHYYVMEE